MAYLFDLGTYIISEIVLFQDNDIGLHFPYWSTFSILVHIFHICPHFPYWSTFSISESLKGKLDIYVSYLRKVRILRRKKSTGLMIAKQHGIDQSHTDIIVVMDSHHEVANGIYI